MALEAGVFCHSQVVEDQADIACELSHFLSNAPYALGFDDSDGESAKSGDVFGAVARAYATSIFIVVPIDDVVTAILDGPVTSVDREDTLGIGLLRRSTGDAVGDFRRDFAAFFVYGLPVNHEGLSDVGKVEVVIQFGCGPNLSGVDSSMVERRMINEIRFLPLFEVQGDIFEKSGLVSLDREMVMSLTLRDQIAGELALGQQGIGGNILALNIDGIKQRDGHLNLVGTFDFFIVFYRHSAHFFWV